MYPSYMFKCVNLKLQPVNISSNLLTLSSNSVLSVADRLNSTTSNAFGKSRNDEELIALNSVLSRVNTLIIIKKFFKIIIFTFHI